MKKSILFFQIILLTAAMLTLPVYADDASATSSGTSTQQIEVFADNSYAVIETTEYDESCITDTELSVAPMLSSYMSLTKTSAKTASRTYTYYSKSGDKKWSMTLTGHFTYNGSSAKATSSSVSYKIFRSGWSCSYTDHSISGAVTRADGTFKHGILTKDVTIGLKCSANGSISPVNY